MFIINKNIHIFIFLFIIIHFKSWSQRGFGNGYYIVNNGEKIECLLQKPINNPSEIIIKKGNQLTSDTISIHEVQEFEIYQYAKYKRFLVPHNNSLKVIQQISNNTRYDTLFLHYLVEGKANLYEYIDSQKVLYYFDTDSINITYLIYDKYFNSYNNIVEKNIYKQQLKIYLTCPINSNNLIRDLNYNRNDLVNFFVEHHKCNGEQFLAHKEKINTYSMVKFGIGASAMEFYRALRKFNLIGINYTAGIEWGFYINSRFLFLAEGLFNINKLSKEENFGTIKVDYINVELLMAIKYQINKLSSKYNLYIGGGYNFGLPIKSIIDFNDIVPKIPITPFDNLIFDLNVSKDNWSINILYDFPRKMIVNSLESVSFQSLTLMVGYKF